MNTQGAVEVPSSLPVVSAGAMWDGNEKGWTLVQYSKRSKSSSMSKMKSKMKSKSRSKNADVVGMSYL
jgi:hypothetical protein